MKVLIVGGGGREHALAWKFRRDDPSIELIAAPGNPGIATLGRCEAVGASDVAGLLALAKSESVGLTVVGPEAPLDAGIVDAFRAERLPIFGPTCAAARIETSKTWAKDLMKRAGVPTAAAQTFSDPAAARAEARRLGAPVVIKATGLAAGKGVVVAVSLNDADDAIAMMLEQRAFGDAGREVLVEEFMTGEELSIFALTDGTHAMPMIAAQDHKRIGEGDTGLNTGGMGAYAPVSIATSAVGGAVMDTVFEPTLAAMRKSGSPFTGLLYAGIMLTPQGPKVVEFNCRFGDPETEAILPLLDSSLLAPIRAIAEGESIASAAPYSWRAGAAVTTVVAAEGYPQSARAGDAITLPALPPNVTVFHSGTKRDAAGTLLTAGGRVLAVTAVAKSLAEAQRASAAYAESVSFEGRQFRRDIGWRDLAQNRA
ncbi:MAG: phosphoribosylamine--glycine ligase [Gemmatimonadetes bacterium]|nr:phosphoribosylamine--glycine ligase [Gemmatimonadota bacterium]